MQDEPLTSVRNHQLLILRRKHQQLVNNNYVDVKLEQPLI